MGLLKTMLQGVVPLCGLLLEEERELWLARRPSSQAVDLGVSRSLFAIGKLKLTKRVGMKLVGSEEV